jgi:hypothetical protein
MRNSIETKGSNPKIKIYDIKFDNFTFYLKFQFFLITNHNISNLKIR